MKKVLPIALISFVLLIVISNFNLTYFYRASDNYDVSGVYIGCSSVDNKYKILQISTDQDGYIVSYDGDTYQLNTEYGSLLGEDVCFLTGEYESSINIIIDCNSWLGDVYIDENDEFEISLFEEIYDEYVFYDENGKSVDGNVELSFYNNKIKIIIDEKYETQWIELTTSNYSNNGFSFSKLTLTDISDTDTKYYLDLNTYSNSFYTAMSYAIRTYDENNSLYYVDSNFLVSGVDVDSVDFESSINNIVGTYVNSNGSIDVEITESKIYLQVSYLEQYYDSECLANIDMAALVPIIETGSYLKIIEKGENTYLLKIFPCDLDYLTGTTIYQIALYDYETFEAIFDSTFTKQVEE